MLNTTCANGVSEAAELIDAEALSKLLGIGVATIYKRVQAGRLPQPNRNGRSMMWRKSEVSSLTEYPAIKTESPVPQPEHTPEPPARAHHLFSTLLYYVSRRRHTYLHGPMGSGKSHAAHQVAETLGLHYAYVSLNPQSPASLLSGFIDAQGRFVSTEFYRCYTEGGVFCIDELDNASASLLTTLNSALANGAASFPNGMQKKHPDFVLVATGNTTGRGGDWQYPERRKIDEATLDRLSFIAWNYDETLEADIAIEIHPSDETKIWIEWVREIRRYVSNRANGIKGGVYATPRAIFAAVEDLKHAPVEITPEMIADSTVFKGIDSDTKTRILNACPLPAIHRAKTSAPTKSAPAAPATVTSNEELVPLTGNTWPVRHQLRAMGARWDKQNKQWLVPAAKFEEARKLAA